MALTLGDLNRPRGLKRKAKRLGRGIGSGRGKTSGKGHKGELSRKGAGHLLPGFEGGQMTIIRRVPKRGFTNKFKKEWNVINLGAIEKTDSIVTGAVVDKTLLYASKLLRKTRLPLKVLGKGAIKKTLTVKAEAFSEGAKKAITEAGGKWEIVKE